MKVKFQKYLEDAVGVDNARVAVSALTTPASVSVRLNPYKFSSLSVLVPSSAGSSYNDSPLDGVASSDGSSIENHCISNISVEGFSDSAVGAFFGCGAERVPWCDFGYVLSHRPEFTLDPFFHGGAYYVQDSSAMFVGEVFRKVLPAFHRRQRCLKVLDLCAAPGGKTTDLASSLRGFFGDNFLLVANEVIGERAAALRENASKWGDPCVMVTSADPSAFASLRGFFDIILADVPCSGEGMFRKSENAVEQWSEENVAMCAARQRRIIADVWPSLSDGGVLIYSTCTFNRCENDDNLEWMVENLGCEPLSIDFSGGACGFDVKDLGSENSNGTSKWKVLRTKRGFSLVPGFVPGEGQYCAAVRKTDGECFENEGKTTAARKSRTAQNFGNVHSLDRKKFSDALKHCGEWLSNPDNFIFCEHTGILIAVPQTVASEMGEVRASLRTLGLGCAVGTEKGSGIVPNGDLALCLNFRKDAFPRVDVDLSTALSFLHRDTLCLSDAPKGYLTIVYKGLPLGFVKNVGNRCNNLLPLFRRIRMEVASG